MKQVFPIGSVLLAVYLLALPILIGIHAGQHGSHDKEVHEKSELVFQSSECELCDLYQNQVGVLILPFIPDARLPQSLVQKFVCNSVAKIPHTYTSLRGPPSQLGK